jgi:hypothetical protein
MVIPVSSWSAQACRSIFSRRAGPAVLLVLAFLVCGCSRLPSVRLDSPFGRSGWVETHDAHVEMGPPPAMIVTVTSQKDENLSLRISIDEIEGADDCLNSIELSPRQSVLYRCSQRSVKAGKRFHAEIVVYRDVGQTRVAERIRRLIDIQEGEGGELILVGRSAD